MTLLFSSKNQKKQSLTHQNENEHFNNHNRTPFRISN